MVGARNNPYWTGSYDREARRFHPTGASHASSTWACTTASTRTWWTIVGRDAPGAGCCSAGCCSAGCWEHRIGVDRLLRAEQVYANPAANQRGDLQGAAEKLQAPQITAPAGTVHGESGSVTLRIFVDRSILEVYCGGAALTDRLYPDVSATRVGVFAEGGVAHVKTVPAWPSRGTW